MWTDYSSGGGWDELIGHDGDARPGCSRLMRHLAHLGITELRSRQHAAERSIQDLGITFSVQSKGANVDRSWPFDVVPRVIAIDEWARISRGLVQRLVALNLLIGDLYGEQRIVRDGVFPTWLLETSSNFRPQCVGVKPPLGIWAHVCGSDLVRGSDGTMYVLEDNLRVPSGVSYMIENRQLTKRVFGELFRDLDILPVDNYPNHLFDLLTTLSPRPGQQPVIAVLTPGIYNAAYFEHSFLARGMGVHLVEGSDLFVDDDCVYLNTITGRTRVDVIYRRIDDLYLDPEAFRPDSLIGVPGLMRSWRAGKVAIVNAPGAGVADDKAVYAFLPQVIRYYLGEEPLIENVPTFLCADDSARRHVLANLANLVVKPTNEAGGYGVIVGSQATAAELDECRRRVEADPRNWIAQPIVELSTVPTLCDGMLVSRHVDLRPFILSGVGSEVTPGGLTRVALQEGSLVVNSSQGGGSKDTWIVDPSVSLP
ncbi:MAG: circularly permuted type 2 ATP-grasp protein [Acidimicrobiales bacterium]